MKLFPHKNVSYLFFLIIILYNGCAKEVSIPVKADFEISIVNNDYSVPVTVEVNNKSTGGDNYEWSFEGATVLNSGKKTPDPIIYVKAGNYKIILKVSNKDRNKDEKVIEIKVDAAMKPDFDWQMQGSDIAPLTLQMQDKSLGATQYAWEFEAGNPFIFKIQAWYLTLQASTSLS